MSVQLESVFFVLHEEALAFLMSLYGEDGGWRLPLKEEPNLVRGRRRLEESELILAQGEDVLVDPILKQLADAIAQAGWGLRIDCESQISTLLKAASGYLTLYRMNGGMVQLCSHSMMKEAAAGLHLSRKNNRVSFLFVEGWEQGERRWQTEVDPDAFLDWLNTLSIDRETEE